MSFSISPLTMTRTAFPDYESGFRPEKDIYKPSIEKSCNIYFGNGNFTRPVITQEEKARYLALQEQAEAKRKAMPGIVQMFYPLKENGKKVGIKQMEQIEQAIACNPTLKNVDLEQLKNIERDNLSMYAILDTLVYDPDEKIAHISIKAIANMHDSNMRDTIVLDLSKNSEPKIRQGAAQAIESLDNPNLQVSIIKELLNDPDYDVRKEAAKSVIYIKDPDLMDSTIQTVAKHKEKSIKLEAAKAAPNISDLELRDSVIQSLANDSEDDVRLEAARVVSHVNNPELRDSLIQKLLNDKRTINLEVISSVPYISNLQLKDSIIQKLTNDSDDAIKRKSIPVMASISNLEVKEPIICSLAEDFSPGIRLGIAHSIANIDDSQLQVSIIKKLVRDKDASVKQTAAKNAAAIKDTELRDSVILELSKDDNLYVKRGISESTSSISNPKIKKLVVETLSTDRDYSIKEKIAESTCNIINSQLKNSIISNLSKDSDWRVRQAAAKAIVNINNSRLQLSIIKELVTDNDNSVKQAAALSAGDIKNPELRDSVILKLSKNDNLHVKQGAAYAAVKMTNPKLRDSVIYKLSMDDNNRVRLGAAQAAYTISDAALKKSVIFSLSRDKDQFVQQEIIKSVATLDDNKFKMSILRNLSKNNFRFVRLEAVEALSKISSQQTKHLESSPYFKLFNQGLLKIDPTISLTHALPAFDALISLGRDGGELRDIISEYKKVYNYALEHRKNFATAASGVKSEDEMKNYLAKNAAVIMKGIVIAGRGVILNKFDEKQEKFDSFLQTMKNVLDDEEISKSIYKVCQLPDSDNTRNAAGYIKIIRLAEGFCRMNKQQELLDTLAEMIKNGQADTRSLTKTYIKDFAQDCGMIQEKMDVIKDENYGSWNIKYIHLIPVALQKFPENSQQQLRDIFKATLEGRYHDLINDTSTGVGKANKKTKAVFKENKLNFDTWMHYDQRKQYTVYNGSKIELKLWERQPGYDLFQGNYSQCCVALDGTNGRAIVEALMHNFVQMLEIKDYASNKNIGKVLMYWAKDLESGEPVLIADNIQIQEKYRNIGRDIKDAFTDYMKDFGEAVAGKPVVVMMGANFNQVPEGGLIKDRVKFKVLGETVNSQYYLNSLGTEWSTITEPQVAYLFSLHKPSRSKQCGDYHPAYVNN